MQRKEVTNAGVLAVGSFSLVGWLLPALFRSIGWIEWAQGLGAVFALFSDPRISWSGIYVLLFCGALSLGAANNWRALKSWWVKRRQAKRHDWNMSLDDAASYVAFGSWFGEALPAIDTNKRLSLALSAVWEGAKIGKITLGGSSPGFTLPKPIPRRELRRGSLQIKTTQGHIGSIPKLYDLKIAESVGSKTILYDKIFADRYALKRVWPQKPDRF